LPGIILAQALERARPYRLILEINEGEPSTARILDAKAFGVLD
jgi:hypothetical protein